MLENSISVIVKIVICGEIGVGKTCLFNRINNLKYDSNPKTTSNDYHKKIIEKDNIKVNCEFWDTAGQEKFYSLNRIFFKDAQIAIIVYDITRTNTFEKIKDFWFNEIINNAKNSVIIGIAGNKSDLYTIEEVNENEARDYANSINASFKLTSALENKGISDLFNETIDIFLGIIPKPNKNFHQPNNKVIKSFSLNKTKSKKKKNDSEESNDNKVKCC